MPNAGYVRQIQGRVRTATDTVGTSTKTLLSQTPRELQGLTAELQKIGKQADSILDSAIPKKMPNNAPLNDGHLEKNLNSLASSAEGIILQLRKLGPHIPGVAEALEKAVQLQRELRKYKAEQIARRQDSPPKNREQKPDADNQKPDPHQPSDLLELEVKPLAVNTPEDFASPVGEKAEVYIKTTRADPVPSQSEDKAPSVGSEQASVSAFQPLVANSSAENNAASKMPQSSARSRPSRTGARSVSTQKVVGRAKVEAGNLAINLSPAQINQINVVAGKQRRSPQEYPLVKAPLPNVEEFQPKPGIDKGEIKVPVVKTTSDPLPEKPSPGVDKTVARNKALVEENRDSQVAIKQKTTGPRVINRSRGKKPGPARQSMNAKHRSPGNPNFGRPDISRDWRNPYNTMRLQHPQSPQLGSPRDNPAPAGVVLSAPGAGARGVKR